LLQETKYWQLSETKLNKALVGQEVDASLWSITQDLLATDKLKKYLYQPLPLLVEMVMARIAASNYGLGLAEFLNQELAFKSGGFSLPTPLITMFNGGRFGDTNLDFEDYLLIPLTKNKNTLRQKLDNAGLVYRKLAELLQSSGYDSDLGSLGGYAPDLVSTIEAIDLMIAAINLAGFTPGQDFGLGIDVGSANLYDSKEHCYLFKLSHNYFNTANLSHLYEEWLKQYPIFYLEDCLASADTAGWHKLSDELRTKLVLAGDKLFNNDIQIFRQNLKLKLANTLVLDFQAHDNLRSVANLIKLAQKHNYQIVMSCGDNETDDTFVSDLAVASGADFVKFGSLARYERVAKYNRLLLLATKLENYF